jgi:hypothetical protein
MPEDERQYGLGGPKHKRNPRWLYLVFLAVLAVISMSVAPQRIADLYGPQPGLGKPWGRAFGVLWYAPWMVLVWRESLPDDCGFISRSVVLGQVVFLSPQFLVLGLWLSRLRLSKGREDLPGSARWAKEADIRDMGLLNGRGVYVGGWALTGTPSLTASFFRVMDSRPRPSTPRRRGCPGRPPPCYWEQKVSYFLLPLNVTLRSIWWRGFHPATFLRCSASCPALLSGYIFRTAGPTFWTRWRSSGKLPCIPAGIAERQPK